MFQKCSDSFKLDDDTLGIMEYKSYSSATVLPYSYDETAKVFEENVGIFGMTLNNSFTN